MKKRSWTDEQLVAAVRSCKSYRAVIMQIGLIPAGGNFRSIQQYIKILALDTGHFTGKGWNSGDRFRTIKPEAKLSSLLLKGTLVQSNTLKQRLFRDGILSPACQQCGWAKMAPTGVIPVELDHINGDIYDNRLENLRILCPNCHSMTPTYRGRNMKKKLSLKA